MSSADLDTITSGIDLRIPARPRPGVLVVLRGRQPHNQLIGASSGAMTVGRAEGCAVRLDGDLEAARDHALIRFHGDDGVEITDRGSKNGTYVDSERIVGGRIANRRKVVVVRCGGSVMLVGDWQSYDRGRFTTGEIVQSPRLDQAHGLIAAAASTGRTTLVLAESGSGKEHACQVVYREASKNRGGPLVVVNCANLVHETAAGLLFGYVKGAFTNAHRDHIGYFEEADGGVLVLDEIGTLSLAVQADLLRVIQDRLVRKVGAEKSRKVNVHIVCSTNADLAAAVARGTFREDLYMRLRDAEVRLPPLRERLEEMPLIIARTCTDLGLGPDFVEACLLREWPGNVRDLIFAVKRAADHARAVHGTTLKAEDLAAAQGAPPPSEPVRAPEPEPEKKRAKKPRDPVKFATFERVYLATGSVAEAAAAAGISVSTGYEWAKEIDSR